MRMPQKPPLMKDLYQPNSVEEARAFMQKLGSQEVVKFVQEANDKYRHWDKLRYKKRPDGVTPQLMWYAVKMSRIHQRQFLPLSFIGNRKLSYVLTPRHLEWLHSIDKQAGGAIGSTSDCGLPDEEERYLFNSLMEEAIASSQLEGASTTRPIAKAMLRENRKPRNTAERMIL